MFNLCPRLSTFNDVLRRSSGRGGEEQPPPHRHISMQMRRQTQTNASRLVDQHISHAEQTLRLLAASKQTPLPPPPPHFHPRPNPPGLFMQNAAVLRVPTAPAGRLFSLALVSTERCVLIGIKRDKLICGDNRGNYTSLFGVKRFGDTQARLATM